MLRHGWVAATMLRMLAGLLFTYSLVAVVFSVNALRSNPNPRSRFPALWLPAMLISEVSPVVLVFRLIVGGLAWWGGLWDQPVGRIGLGVLAVSIGLLSVIAVRDWWATRVIERQVPEPYRLTGSWLDRFRRDHESLPPGVKLISEVEYAEGLTVDVFAPDDASVARPCVVYVHGGGWTGGAPHSQGVPLFHHLAQRGWVVCAIRYPLAPAASFLDQAIAVRRSIVWARAEGREFGIDPGRIALVGGSAGAHLASVAGLVDDPRLRRGFDEADASVAAIVSLYGIFDFVNRNLTRPDWRVIPVAVMKATPAEEPELYRLASPIDHVRQEMPPMLVVHGSIDSLVPPQESRAFVEAAERVGGRVEYFEVPGAQHAFDAVNSPRTRAVVGVVTRFLEVTVGSPTPDLRG